MSATMSLYALHPADAGHVLGLLCRLGTPFTVDLELFDGTARLDHVVVGYDAPDDLTRTDGTVRVRPYDPVLPCETVPVAAVRHLVVNCLP